MFNKYIFINIYLIVLKSTLTLKIIFVTQIQDKLGKRKNVLFTPPLSLLVVRPLKKILFVASLITFLSYNRQIGMKSFFFNQG